MPSRSSKQQHFMGSDLTKKRAGKKTKTGMSESQLEDFASMKPGAKVRGRRAAHIRST